MLDAALDQALVLAFRHLSRRERTCQEMRGHLERRGVEPGVIDAALHELSEQGYLDDARFARLFAEDKRGLEQWGAERIRRDLLRRGVAGELIAAALEEGSAEAELERAVALLQRRLPQPPCDRRSRERALGLLLRRGYGYETASRAVWACAEQDAGAAM